MFLLSASFFFVMIATPLVDQLGAASFAERDSAQQLLELLGEVAQPALVSGLKSSDPETRHRCELALTKLRNFGLARMPRIDSVPASGKERRDIIRRRVMIHEYLWAAYHESCSYCAATLHVNEKVRLIPDDILYRRGTALYARELLKDGRSPREVRRVLIEIQENESIREKVYLALSFAK